MPHIVNLNIVNKYLSENSFLSIMLLGTFHLIFTKDFFCYWDVFRFKSGNVKKSIQLENTVIRDKIKVR